MARADLPLETLQGESTTYAEITEGDVTLVVNVASKCGLTPQYAGLEALHQGRAGFTVLGVPSNQFGGQEPGTATEIADFCSSTYGVTFPLLAKADVNGPDRHPLFEELTEVPDATGYAGDVRWNFEKWLLSSDGEAIGRFGPQITPDDPELLAAIDRALGRS